MKRVVVACGGTGGHFYPGYVLARALRERGWEALFLLRREDPAGPRLEAEGLPFVELDLSGLPRRPGPAWVSFAWRLARSLALARRVLRSFRPACVAGMGGYLTFPAVAAAWWLRVPSLIHESNAVLGLANRAVRPLVSRLCLGLPLERPLRGGGAAAALTGTPVRPELESLPAPSRAREALGLESGLPTVLVFGGSQGARGLNRAVPQALRELAPGRGGEFQCLHLSGPREESAVRSLYDGSPVRAQVRGYLDAMHLAYAAADLVVCRAGAGTIAELVATRRPALLVPYPSAAAGHQDANARVLERAGTARTLPEDTLTPSRVASVMTDLLFSGPSPGSKLREMAGRYESLRLPSPARCVAALVAEVEALARAGR